MSNKDKYKYNLYMKKYMNNRYKKRRDYVLHSLGNRCTHCGAKDNLELDHIDPKTKKFNISKLWSISQSEVNNEVSKCQLLCKACHTLKTLADMGRVSAKDKHGTLSSYRYCKCDLCKKAKSNNNKLYKIKRKLIKEP